jgi:hypothetical protein
MIPTMIVFGFVLGRWWRWSILAGGIVWALLLIATHSMTDSSAGIWLGAIFFGAANTAVGVVLFQLARLVVRAFRPELKSAVKR